MACPICSNAENMRAMNPVVIADENKKWVCGRCGLERFEYHRKKESGQDPIVET